MNGVNKQKSHQRASWQALEFLAHKDWSLNELFQRELIQQELMQQQLLANKKLKTENGITYDLPQSLTRVEEFHIKTLGFYADFSKQFIDDEVKQALINLANSNNLKQKIDSLMAGDKINTSENRSALHTALRLPKSTSLTVDGVDVVHNVHKSLDKMSSMADKIRTGLWRGYSGRAITDVVNLGVGGSDLGPLMATDALNEWVNTDIKVHFVSNMDGSQLDSLLKTLNTETTLFIIASKSFNTIDTLSNAKTALAWLCRTCSKKTVLRRHFIAISSNDKKMSEWGIHPANQLTIWDWVGGRFSMWSVIGLAIAIRIGMPNFREMLAGAHAMDEHFSNTDFTENLPVMMGLLGVWNSTFLGINAHTVLPYDGRLKYLPSYLTQLEMESNGKSVTHDGNPVAFSTCPILWGEVGSNAQHAFYQLLHQGTQKVSSDFIACVKRYNNTHHYNDTLQQQQALSLANCLAQSRVLAFGNHAADMDSHDLDETSADKFRSYHGNQPSTTLLLNELTPSSLGSLIALYEHKVFVMAAIWDVNPFDQWGVEMGKQVATQVYNQLISMSVNDDNSPVFDHSTDSLLAHIQKHLNS